MATLIVVSDLHMGSGPVDDFEPEIEKHLIGFLEEWRARDDATELVINGDLLDFVQAPPYKGPTLRDKAKDGTPLCFTEDQSCQKLKAIGIDHKGSFQALGAFLAYRKENRVVVLPGNHDADFYWEAVQQQFRELVCGTDGSAGQRLIIWLDPVYRSAACKDVWIEHGHQYDPVNSFFINGEPRWSTKKRPILQDRTGTERLYECIGTRFMIQFLNDLDKKYPYVDNVKPFWRFLQLFGASALRPGFGSIQAAVAVASMDAYLGKMLVTRPKDVLKLDGGRPSSASNLVCEAYKKATESRQKAFIQAVGGRGFVLKSNPEILLGNEKSAAPLLEFLSENLDALESIDPGPSGGTLKLGESFLVNETNELRTAALKIIGNDGNKTRVVIMGHTHEVVNEPGYINTGSWTPYYRLQEKESLKPWTVLRTSGWKEFPYQLNYALAQPGASPPASLRTYK